MTPTALAPRFFIAVAAILLFCRLVAWLLGKVGQPPVVGEMIAGVLLGPSLLGLLLPRAEHALFPAPLLPVLYVAGQIGLVALHVPGRLRVHPGPHRPGGPARPGAVSLAGVSGRWCWACAAWCWRPTGAPMRRARGLARGVGGVRRGRAGDHRLPDAGPDHHRARPAGTRHGSLALASGRASTTWWPGSCWPWCSRRLRPAARRCWRSAACCCSAWRCGPAAAGLTGAM